ncbi:MAG: hypothetical protein U0172_06410 [Nitrospiraceae bacterium]
MTMGPIIQELLFCLLPAAAIGAVVGWMLKKLTVEEQQVGITRFELEVKLTAAERKLLAVQKELETVQAGAQAKTSHASFATEESTQLRAQLVERDDMIQSLRTRLSSLDAMPVKVATQDATIADLQGKLTTLASVSDTLREREQELADLRSQVGDMVSKVDAEEMNGHLQSRVAGLEQDLAQAKSAAEQEETWARQVLSERDGTIEHLHEELARFQRGLSDVTLLRNQLSERDETIANLRHDLNEAQRQEAQRVQADHDRLQQVVRERDQDVERMRHLIVEAEREAESLRQQSRDHLARLDTTVEELDTARHQLIDAEQRLSTKDQEVQRLTESMKLMVPSLEVEKLRAKLKAATKDGQVVTSAKAQSTEGRAVDQAEMFAEASVGEPAATPAETLPKWGAATPDGMTQDDLKRIWGVGPRLERLLHQQGVFYFRQIASWTKDDIQTIDQKLDTFKGRILRDNWINGAKEEHYRKYGERL